MKRPFGIPEIMKPMDSFNNIIDGKKLTNRRDVAHFCREHDVVQVGDDFKKKRREYIETGRRESEEAKKHDASQHPLVLERIKQLQQGKN